MIGGITIDLLLLALFIVVSQSNKRALAYADSMTEEVSEKANKLKQSNNELRKTKSELEKIAHYDLITNLPNRHSFFEYLEKALARSKRSKTLLAVCFLDLDNFKQVNDNMGHNGGDQLLKAIPEALSPVLRDTDYLARLSGDEFGLILESIQSTQEISRILTRYINTFNQPFSINGYEINISASIGVAVFPLGGNDAEELLKNADIAMYKAKAAGKNTFIFFNETTNKQVQRRHAIEVALRKAIEKQEFHLVYQPQIDANTNKIYGVETLIRWAHDGLDQISPAEFIPIAEECGLIDKIGIWVIERVGKDYNTLKKISVDLEVSINTSIRQLESLNFDETILTVLKKHNLPCNKITLEVTETAIMRHPDLIIDIMTRLSNLGICFALDDFGTGYSSMNYLKRLPISYIKIDQGFVHDIEDDPSDAAIVRAIIQLSNALGTKTIAEGVETVGEYKFLQKHGCEYLQGYYFDKPLALDELIKKYVKQDS